MLFSRRAMPLATPLLALAALAFLLAPVCRAGDPPAADLKATIERLIQGSGAGAVAVAFHDLASGEEVLVHPDDVFHAASTMKVAVMAEVYRQAEAGTLSLDERIALKKEFVSIADGRPYALDPADDSEPTLYQRLGQRERVSELTRRMITESSNLATNLLVERVTARKADELMRGVGAAGVRVLRGVEDGAAYRRGMNNTTTARGLMRLMSLVADRALVSPGASDAMLALLLQRADRFPARWPPREAAPSWEPKVSTPTLFAALILGTGQDGAGGGASTHPVGADLVLTGGRIWTVNTGQPEAEAVATWRGRLLFVGRDAEVRALIGLRTRVVDLKGRRVLPGFYDSHVHLLASGIGLGQVALKDAKDEEEFGRRLRAFDRKLPPGRWMLGGGWNHDRTFAGRLPDAGLIDKYVRDRPALLGRYDGHMAVANSRALEAAGITAATPDPAGGVIDRGPGGRPTGTLRDAAMGLVQQGLPSLSDDEIAEALRAALAEARRHGVTSVQDMDGSDEATRRRLFGHYQQLARRGSLTLRIGLRWPLQEWESLGRLGVQSGLGNDWVKIGGVKGFVDGSLGSSTARMFQPYLNEPRNSGIYVTPLKELRAAILGADRAGLSVAVHAIGDRANADLLDIFREVTEQNGPRDRRLRIEHAQHLRPEDYPRFRDFGVIASMQPYHAIDDGCWAEGRIGKGRCASSYALRSLLRAGARVAFGSDWPVAPLNPLLGIDAAVNRRTLDGKNPGGWFPEQRIEVAEAIEAYTLASAYAAFEDCDKGSLEVGKLADLVVLSRDILAGPQRDHIAETEVVMTVVGGRVVYEKDPSEPSTFD